MMTLSLLLGDGTVQISLANGQEVQGEFIGTYMDHVHVLTGEKLYYYACDDILSIISPEETFDYDCSENTVTADILFPPELDPMTGEWAQKLPDVFNPDIVQPIETTEADGVDTDPPTVDLGEVDPRFDEEVSTFEEKDVTEEDFIMINGVKYVRAAPDKETDQDNLPRTTKKKKTLKNNDDNYSLLYPREIRAMAIQDAERHHDKLKWELAGIGSIGTGFLGAGIGTIGGIFTWLAGGVVGLALPYYLFANNYDASNSLYYPFKIKTSRDKELYKKTYLKEAKKLAKESVKKAPKNAVYCGCAFFAFTILLDGY